MGPRMGAGAGDATGGPIKFLSSNHKLINISEVVCGGDASGDRGCLSSTELDLLLGADAVLPANTFFLLKNGFITEQQVSAHLRPGVMVVWVRYHWVALRLSGGGAALGVEVFDSASSAPVTRDLRRLAYALGLAPPSFPPCPQQRRGSNECGLFAALFAWLLAAGETPPRNGCFADLSPLRAAFPDKVKMLLLGRSIFGLIATSAHQPDDLKRYRHNPYDVAGSGRTYVGVGNGAPDSGCMAFPLWQSGAATTETPYTPTHSSIENCGCGADQPRKAAPQGGTHPRQRHIRSKW